jgi:hypothetical protein
VRSSYKDLQGRWVGHECTLQCVDWRVAKAQRTRVTFAGNVVDVTIVT